MDRTDAFSAYHPAVSFVYFTAVIFFSAFTMHPAVLITSAVCSSVYYITLNGRKAVLPLLKAVLPLLLITVIINPVMSNQGNTVLFRLPWHRNFTLESTLYGLAAGIMLLSLLLWFFNLSKVLTADKFLYLSGAFLPSLSLIITMSLRFIPLFKDRFIKVAEMQAATGNDIHNGGIRKRIKIGVTCLLSVISWSLENSVQTADSMKSRGYGTGKRTSYSVFRFEDRDRNALIFISVCIFFLICAAAKGSFTWSYFPVLSASSCDIVDITAVTAYFMLCIFPVYTDKKEERTWKLLKYAR